MPSITMAADALAKRVASARFGFSLDRAVGAFVRLLSAVPDSNPLQVSRADVADLRKTSERVIESIERRLETRRDRQSIRLSLASAVYRIRYETEGIERWHRHFRTSQPSGPIATRAYQ